MSFTFPVVSCLVAVIFKATQSSLRFLEQNFQKYSSGYLTLIVLSSLVSVLFKMTQYSSLSHNRILRGSVILPFSLPVVLCLVSVTKSGAIQNIFYLPCCLMSRISVIQDGAIFSTFPITEFLKGALFNPSPFLLSPFRLPPGGANQFSRLTGGESREPRAVDASLTCH